MNSLLFDTFSLVIYIAMLIIFVRFMVQFSGLTAANPHVAPVYTASKVVDIFSRIFPSLGKGQISLSALVLLFLLRLIFIAGLAVEHHLSYTPIAMLFMGSYSLLIDIINMCRYLIIASIIVSWVVVFTNSDHPIIGIIYKVTEPILAPFRRFIPNLGMIDLSPIAAFFCFYLLERALFYMLSKTLPFILQDAHSINLALSHVFNFSFM